MSPESFDIVIPLFRARWNTRAVLEGLTTHYNPRSIHIITPAAEAESLRPLVQDWQTSPLHIHEEDTFFLKRTGLTKKQICEVLDLGESLYTPGWFYQQLLKLGAFEGIENLSEWYVVWDSDLLPVDTWPLIRQQDRSVQYTFALLQHKRWGNPSIVSKWDTWISTVLGVDPCTDREGTFVPHHMWFKQEHLKTFVQRVNRYYKTEECWLLPMMQSANEFGTFSEYWSYVSWVKNQAPEDVAFHPYEHYGESTERFFDDGTGLFSGALKRFHSEEQLAHDDGHFSPSYQDTHSFIHATYGKDSLPSSLAFESSPRHLKKDEKNMHIEELRSRWNMREVELANVG